MVIAITCGNCGKENLVDYDSLKTRMFVLSSECLSYYTCSECEYLNQVGWLGSMKVVRWWHESPPEE